MLLVDAHTHIGIERLFNIVMTKEELLREMDRNDIDIALVQPQAGAPDIMRNHEEIAELTAAEWRNAPFIRLLPKGALPETRFVRGSMFCDLGLVVDPRTQRLIIVTAIDNLCRGASGQAIANANLMLGLETFAGLAVPPLMP